MASLPRGSRQHTERSTTDTAAGYQTASSSLLPDTSPTNRVTRSSARLAAESQQPDDTSTAEHDTSDIKTPPGARKRKAVSSHRDSSPLLDSLDDSPPEPTSRRRKKQKTTNFPSSYPDPNSRSTRSSRRRNISQEVAMSSNEYRLNQFVVPEEVLTGNRSPSKELGDDTPKSSTSASKSRKTSHRSNKMALDGADCHANTHTPANRPEEISPPSQPVSTRKSRKKSSKKDTDTEMKDTDPDASSTAHPKESTPSPPPVMRSDSNDDLSPSSGREESLLAAAMFGRGPSSGLSSTLRALSGMMTGMTSRLRDILTNLRRVDDPSIQMIALEELSNLLLVSNEDNLSGQFSPDPYVKELVTLMQPNPITGEENPEMMLLACRSLANLMEALRGSVANVVYGGAVPVLCQKLLDIQYIDVAEQALSTLAMVSVDFPASIVREGGLTACLQYLDFFATGTQRTAVTTAANCCRNIPHDSFAVIRDVMPILQNVLVSHDQKVVEQGCLCVTRIIDSFKHSPDKIEQLVDPTLLKAVLGLLLPGTTNLIGANIHTEFLRVLAIVARNSPRLSAELLKMNVVDTLYQILTGVSPPSETSDAASNIDSVVIMQALIHRPREQIYEALNVICELLPKVSVEHDDEDGFSNPLSYGLSDDSQKGTSKQSQTMVRMDLLQGCKQQTRRFAMILLPTLTDAYSSTVNLNVRQKVLTAQLKILSNLDIAVVEEALRPVPYASFLASILSQEDHPSLVIFALRASELLFSRLQNIYQYQFHREGVISEIQKLASRTPEVALEPLSRRATDNSMSIKNKGKDELQSSNSSNCHAPGSDSDAEQEHNAENADEDEDVDDDGDEVDEDPEGQNENDDEEIILRDDVNLDEDPSSDSSDNELHSPTTMSGIDDIVILRAKRFLEKYDTKEGQELKLRAEKIREDLRTLAHAIGNFYKGSKDGDSGRQLFLRLAQYFDGDALESITSSELLDSGIIHLLGEILSSQADIEGNARGDFVAAFLGSTTTSKVKTATASNSPTAFSVLIHKLQDLLSRAEHFEVLTVNSSASESHRGNSTSMLSRQIRLKLTADADSDIPATYRDIVVSIHAIATFKALDDYLRPRMTLSERSKSGRRHDMLQQLANARMAQLSGFADSGLFSPFSSDSNLPSAPSPLSNRSVPRGSKSKSETQTPGSTEEAKEVEKIDRRRTSRRGPSTPNQKKPPLPPPEPRTEEISSKLEIVDEKAMGSQTPQNEPIEDSGVEAIVGELQGEGSGDEEDPAAVNMEVASSGRVTARREDGSRVFTPQQPSTPVPSTPRQNPSDRSPLVPPTSSQSSQKRPSSYAAALASVPQDWHIEFSLDGKPIPNNITIYRAVQHNKDESGTATTRSVWSTIHTVKFRKVKGPPPVHSLSTSFESARNASADGLPTSLNGHPITSSILLLLGILHELNASLDDIRDALGSRSVKLYAEPLASFINTKLTAKMNRQLEEPLIVASNCLPEWSEDLARSFPFLFPFETRHLFLQSTSFGYSRSITRWQNSQTETDDRRDRRRDDRPLMGRAQRQKVRIARAKMLESAMKVMDHFGPSPSILEVEYFEEVGTGLGPTLEFYSTVSREFAKKQLKLWRENDTDPKDQYAFGRNGLFPAPLGKEDFVTEKGKKILHAFRMLGMFVARSMLDSRIIDINFSPTFFKAGDISPLPLSIALLRTVDQDLANSMSQLQSYSNKKIAIESNPELSPEAKESAIRNLTIRGAYLEDLCLDFTLPGYTGIELIPDGSNTLVTAANVGEYVQRVLNMTLGEGVQPQIEAFQHGFSQVFPYSSLKAFTPVELVMLFGKVEEDWSIETLMDSIKADHGFNMDSRSVKNLLQVMSELSAAQRRDFLQFVTGSPRLPIGGFKSLTPMFTVVCKPSEPPYTSDDYLPSVMTCANYLKLPDYSNVDVLKGKLNVAIKEGQGAFHLS